VSLLIADSRVFDLLAYLIQNRQRVVSKDELVATIWNGRIISDSALSTRINAVRNAIDDSGGQQRQIRTFPARAFVSSALCVKSEIPTDGPWKSLRSSNQPW
jgi:DNA-binding winged helix-turn-helix (wHTH) protein